MFSYLSRGYGTWEGIAKLETPDSAIRPNRANYVLPPIRKDQYHFHDDHFDHDVQCTKIPQEDLKLPEMPKDSLHIPKTYSTKSGALLLYSEGCTLPGSRRKKRRPQYKTRQKESQRRLETMKDFMEHIMDYKKNGCDPLLLEQLWHRMSSSARDLQPGYSPQRYLGHLSHTTFDPASRKKLLETGSLKSFGTTDGFLPSLLPEYGDHLNRRPQPYTTMSLPPVSPSSSMLGSFTFYKHALSTGAASMVSLPSMNSETVDEQLSAKTAGTFVESLAERLAEVESESGFKRDYDSLNAKEKEDLLTQLLMDITLHNQENIITIPTQNMSDSPTVNTDISYLSDSKGSKSHVGSLQGSYHSVKTLPSASSDKTKSVSSDKTKSVSSNKTTRSFTSDKSLRSSHKQKSARSSGSLKSVPRRGKSVCSLPPIVPKENVTPDAFACKDVDNSSEKATAYSLSSSGSGLSLVGDDFGIGLNGIDIEIENDPYYLPPDSTDVGLDRTDPEARSLRSEKTLSERSLIEALDVQDAEFLHQLRDETMSLKSLGSSVGVVLRTGRSGDSLRNNGVLIDVNTIVDGSLVGGMVHGEDGGGGYGDGDGGSDFVISVDDYGSSEVGDGDIDGDGDAFGKSDGHDIGSDKEESDEVDQHDSSKQTMPTIDLTPATAELQAPHMSLSSLQDEVRLVATEVLSRPKSGRILSEDAEMATLLLMKRMEGLLGPALTENVRVSSAAPKKVRPLGQPRNSDITEKRRVRSAEATLASRNPVKPEENEEKQAQQVSNEEQEPDIDDGSVSKSDETDLSVDDVVVIVGTIEQTGVVKDTGAQSLQVESATPSPLPEGELLTVKDLQPERGQEEEKKQNVPTVKERKESVQKAVKVKKGATTKRGSVAKGKKKKTRARNEPPKTPPFRAGLVPESKPPKGLAQKSGAAAQNGNDKQASPDLQATELETKTEPVQTAEVLTPRIPGRVDSETGEVERLVSTPRSEKSPSLTGGKSLPDDTGDKSLPDDSKSPVSHEDVVSSRVETDSARAQTHSERTETDSARAQTNSPRGNSPSVHEKTPSPRDKTSSPRNKTISPRDQKACPRDRDAVLRENINTDVVTESVESEVRETSPEVVLTEKQRRANARAAQRAAAAERRRQDVERKRREREEARRRAQEEEARLEVLRKDAEVEMSRREEERRIQKEREERERMRVETEQNEQARQERLIIERQRQAKDEWKRRKEQLVAQRNFEEELRKERERVELQIEDERRREYEEKIAHLEEAERDRLMEERRLEEERIKREIQEEKERREEERRQMLEDRRKMEEELAAARDRQLARRTFLETLLRDFQNMLLEQSISRAFTFSYFDILPWFKDRWRDLEEDRPSSKRPSTQLDTVPEESEFDIEQMG